VRFATLQLPAPTLKAPSDCTQLTQVVSKLLNGYKANLSAEQTYICLERGDAIRQPERFALALEAFACLQPNVSTKPIANALQATLAVASEPIALQAMKDGLSGAQVGAQIAKARIAAIASALSVNAPLPPAHSRAQAG
jgi:tRNA nucleotidyltransferase (CCA-adding enzyme)